MREARIALIASVVVAVSGAVWGLYWLPVRTVAEGGLTGAWGTLAITLGAALVMAPVVWVRRRHLMAADGIALISIALGGAAFAFYSIGFLYGRVAIVVLFYLLTPVWSTLIGRFVMGWETPWLRYVAIVLGLTGLTIMLGIDDGIPLPRNSGEWLGLVGGILWSLGTTGMRARPAVPPIEASFILALGAAVTALIVAPIFAPLPEAVTLTALGASVLTGIFWYGLAMVGLMWAATRLDPARIGILLMTEVLVGAASAAWLAGEWLTRPEVIGGLLVITAGIVEVWPVRRRGVHRGGTRY